MSNDNPKVSLYVDIRNAEGARVATLAGQPGKAAKLRNAQGDLVVAFHPTVDARVMARIFLESFPEDFPPETEETVCKI